MSLAQLQAARDSAAATLATLEALLAAEAVQDAPQPSEPVVAAPAASAGLTKPAAFFGALRAGSLLGPALSETETSGCSAVLAAGAGKMPMAWEAYCLATAYHETAHTMQPVKEYGGDAYLRRMYDIEGARPDKARELGNLAPGDGVLYAGRGFVQLTGKANYARAGSILGLPLVESPDLALRPDVAADILVRGMAGGWFSGKTLRQYIPAKPAREHFANARRIVNGTDKADLIAGYALDFYAALVAGGWL